MIDKYTSLANIFHKYTSFSVEGHSENDNWSCVTGFVARCWTR